MKLEVSDVSYSVGRFRLSNLSFHINEGQINGIGGKNGSGKSTLFNEPGNVWHDKPDKTD